MKSLTRQINSDENSAVLHLHRLFATLHCIRRMMPNIESNTGLIGSGSTQSDSQH